MKHKFVKTFLPLLTLIIILLFLSSRHHDPDRSFKRTRLLMGTIVEISLFNSEDQGDAEAVVRGVFDEMKRLEGLLGRRQTGSDVWRINASSPDPVPVSREALEVISEGLRFQELTDGAFDIYLGRLSALWDFDGERTSPPPPEDIEALLENRLAGGLEIDRSESSILKRGDLHLDLGGIAKGYIIDEASRILNQKGLRDFIVNAGGDMRISGRNGDRPWRIGLQHPRRDGKVFASIDIDERDIAIVTSGDYERFFIHKGKRYHHILDPSTGFPADGLISATVLAKDAKTADALCTAVFVMGLEKGMAFIEAAEGVEGVLVGRDEKIAVSDGLRERVVIRWKESD